MQHRRHSIRLKGYDYSQAGAYFITICVHERRPLLQLEPVRQMVERWWMELPVKFPAVELDAFVVMPNHIHGIVAITAGTSMHAEGNDTTSLSGVVQWYKAMTTNDYIRGVKQLGWPAFTTRFWHRNYWEHIVRDDSDLARLRRYIELNPAHWLDDSLHI